MHVAILEKKDKDRDKTKGTNEHHLMSMLYMTSDDIISFYFNDNSLNWTFDNK